MDKLIHSASESTKASASRLAEAPNEKHNNIAIELAVKGL
jgi:hypothetical protein